MSDDQEYPGDKRSGYRKRIESWNNNAQYQFYSKLMVMVLLPLGGFIGAAVYNKVDKNNDVTVRLETQVKAIVEQLLPNAIATAHTEVTSAVESAKAAAAELGRRVGKLEDRADTRGRP